MSVEKQYSPEVSIEGNEAKLALWNLLKELPTTTIEDGYFRLKMRNLSDISNDPDRKNDYLVGIWNILDKYLA